MQSLFMHYVRYDFSHIVYYLKN